MSTPLRPKAASRYEPLWWAIVAVWFMTAVGAAGWVWQYKLTPVAPLEPPSHWPADSIVPLAPQGVTLVMLAHPKCPCTRASMSELARLMTDTQGRVTGHVLVVHPPGTPESWERTDIWERAAAIPGVTVHADKDGVEVQRFGAMVSGYVLLYDAKGQLLFHGGITGARGHEGDNRGRALATEVIAQGSGDGATPTYGCELLNAEERVGSDDVEPIGRR